MRTPVAGTMMKVLTPKGVIGWETTGIAYVDPGGTTCCWKRPRSTPMTSRSFNHDARSRRS